MAVIIKDAEFRKEIKSAPKCCYLFYGEEDYMKSFALSVATEAISPDPSLCFFNEIKFDALSYSPESLLDAMMPLPMMSERKLIVISGLDFNAMRSNEVEALCNTLSKLEDYDYNTVIISVASDRIDPGRTAKKPSAILRTLGEHATLVNFEKNTPAKLAAWVGKHFEHNGVSASADVCAFVIERCGRDMFILSGETDKLSFYVKQQGRASVTREDVLYVATPAVEYDVFAFSNAIASRKRAEALSILRDFRMKKTDPILIMAEISKIINLHEYAVSLILNNRIRPEICERLLVRCREADLELKSTADGYTVLEKLICTI